MAERAGELAGARHTVPAARRLALVAVGLAHSSVCLPDPCVGRVEAQ